MKRIGITLLALSLAACGSETAINDAETPIETQIATYDRATADLPIIDWVERERAAGNTLEFTNVLDSIGVDFIKLALQIGTLDANFVDAYSGPDIWRTEANGQEVDADQLADAVAALQARLNGLRLRDESQAYRMTQLSKQIRAMATRLDVVRGQSVSFDTEVSSIYDVEPPVYDLSIYESVLAEIDVLLPGEGSTAERVDTFRKSLAIPEDKLQVVFERAIKECRDRTTQHYDLPEGEKFTMEFVTDKSWSGYNYYQGNYESLIQINTDFPIIIDRAVDLGCHEGYPGHHVWNLFVEREIIGQRGWIEYSVQPLFGPFGPIAEGTGNYGIELAFTGDDKINFEREVLFPLAGLDPSNADKLAKLNALQGKLSHARNEISRQYLDGQLTREQALPMLQKYLLASAERTEQSLKFVETYRGYVINYNIGRDLAAAYVEAAGDDPDARWAAFRDMLTRPMTASDIVAELE
jgi:hypothetical protein